MNPINWQQVGPELLAALEVAQDHLQQYVRYSEDMRKVGRGLRLSSEYSNDYAGNIIEQAIHKAKGE